MFLRLVKEWKVVGVCNTGSSLHTLHWQFYLFPLFTTYVSKTNIFTYILLSSRPIYSTSWLTFSEPQIQHSLNENFPLILPSSTVTKLSKYHYLASYVTLNTSPLPPMFITKSHIYFILRNLKSTNLSPSLTPQLYLPSTGHCHSLLPPCRQHFPTENHFPED